MVIAHNEKALLQNGQMGWYRRYVRHYHFDALFSIDTPPTFQLGHEVLALEKQRWEVLTR